MSTKHIFPLYLEGAAQSVAAAATAVNWNGTSSLVNCDNTASATLTLTATAAPGTIVMVRKVSGAGTVAINNASATTLYTLSSAVDSSVGFIWDSTGWDMFHLSNPSTLTLTKANITQTGNRNTPVTANGTAGTITTLTGSAMTSNATYTFTLNNSFILDSTSKVIVSAGNNASGIHKLAAHTVAAGSCSITYTSDASTADPALGINFLVIN
jgi:hypothetical protein